MKTDISRDTFHPEKNYSSVRRQQGRVDLDADWNEQVDIQNSRQRLLTMDSLGPVGAPAHDAGFGITASGDAADLIVSSGRFYIDGVLIHNADEFNVSTQPDLPGIALPSTDGNYLAYLKVHERAVTALEDPWIRETALGGPDTTTRMKVIRQVHLAPVTAGDIDSRTIPPEWNTIVSRAAGRLSARTRADDAQSDPCSVGARGGYTGLDNLLYRVEIHDGGPAGTATYKWSRDNGSLVTEWMELDGHTLTLRSTGNDNVLNFAPGQWVEIQDDGLELEGKPGTLAQILRVEGRRITINPDNIRHYPGSSGTLDIAEFDRGVRKVRRWDMAGVTAPPQVPDSAGGDAWLALENGIEIKFDDPASAREYRVGDYWMIPARADNNNIEWKCDSQGGIEHTPHGTDFYYARLAFVNLTAGAWNVLADAREIFPGLTNEELAYAGGDGQLSVPGETLDRPLEVRVTRGATPVPDARVRFTITNGTGTIEDAPGGTSGTALDIKADGEGIARVYWTLADAMAGQSIRAVLLDESHAETPLYVVFGAGSGVASGIQYTPISTDSSVAGTTNVQEALDALADNKVNRAGDTMTGNLTVNADLEVTGNMTIRGNVIARDAQQQAGDVLLGDDDVDRVIIHGTLQSNHSSGSLEINSPVHMRTTDPTKSPLRVDGPTTGGAPRLYRLPLDLDHTDAGATTLNDYQLLITVDTASLIASGRMQTDGKDILFEDQDGTLLPFWIESDLNTANTRIWVRVSHIAAGANRVIYMLYGNENAVAQSSSGATFLADIVGVEAAYNMNEGTGANVADLSGNGADATFAGNNPPAWTTGRFGGGLDFAGGDARAESATRNWGFTTTATISAWINTTSADPVTESVVSLGHAPADDALILSLAQGRPMIQNHSSSGNYSFIQSDSAVNSGQWVHIVGVIDGGIAAGDFKLYINGARASATHTSAGSPTPIQDATPRSIVLGGIQSGVDIFYPGLLDQVRVYSTALTDAQVAAMAAGHGYVSPALPGHELIRRFASIEPTITIGAHEANPLSETPILFAQEASGNIGIGTDEPDEKLSVDGIIETKTGGIKFPDGTIQTTAGGPGGSGGEPLPLGTIMAWHRDFAGAPAIPDGWVECNGQILSDVDSPYDGLVIPNLNGEKRFLRGGDASGAMEADQFRSHGHSPTAAIFASTPRHISEMHDGFSSGPAFGDSGHSGVSRNAGVHASGGSETRPINMSVVWIMKIKETGESGLWTPNTEGIHYNAGKVSVGTNVADEQLTVTGAISLQEKILEPDTTDDFGKLYVRENDLSYLTLNGTDQYVDMPSLQRPAINDFSFATWFKMDPAIRTADEHSWIFDTREIGTGGPSCEALLRATSNGDQVIFLSMAWPSGGGSGVRVAIGNPTGEWHHLAVTREGAIMRIYFNGRFMNSVPDTGSNKSDPMPFDKPWRIGHRSTFPGDPLWKSWPGSLDDFGVWERALTSDEIATLHNSGRGSDVPVAFASDLIAFYPMSQSATPGQLDDISGNNFHGNIQNGANIIPEKVGSLYFKDGFGNVTSLAGGGDSYRTGGSGNQVPLGTIMAWHKSFENTPAIPDGWVECDGQTLDDPASPYHGQVIPDLNGDGRFLRGSDTSGVIQADQFRSHAHQQQTGAYGENIPHGIRAYNHSGSFGSTLYTLSSGGSETRPVNMSIVWIMKIRETDRDRGLWRERGEDIYFDDGRVGVGAKTAGAKVHIVSNDLVETPFRVDAKISEQNLQGRLFRGAITLENTDTNDLVDQQIPLTIDTASLITAGKLRADGADMIFAAADGFTRVPHFIERDLNTPNTRVWVRIPSIPAGESIQIFLQYGKSDASSSSSAAATFIRAIEGAALAWDFNEGSGASVSDASENGNNGAVTTGWTAGNTGSAISVTGNAGAETITPRTWGFSTAGTISVWIKPDPGTGGVVASLQNGNVNDEFVLFAGDGPAWITSHNNGGQFAQRSSVSPTPAGQWSHLVGVIEGDVDAQQYRVYVNGVREEGTINISNSPFPISDANPRRFHVGTRPARPLEFFRGAIDHVRLYDRPLTDQEVADLYAHASTFSPAMPGHELLHRPLPVPPTITFSPEEPNPVSGSPVLFAQNLTGNIGIGTDEPAAKLHIAGEAGVDGIMFPDGSIQTTAGGPGGGGDSTPLGTIIAWHKNLSGTPAIPDGWVECDGQVLNDSDSPFDGQVIPNLNGDGRFLRGGDTSGALQDDAFQGHWHANPMDQGTAWFYGGGTGGGTGFVQNTGPVGAEEPIDDGTHGEPRTADETRPINMSVVWIMKVKETGGQSGLWTPANDGIHYAEGKVSVGTAIADEQLTVSGAISLEEKILEPNTTDDFGKIYVRENDLSYARFNGAGQYISMPSLNRPGVGDFTIAVWFKYEDIPRNVGDHSFLFDTRRDGVEGPSVEAAIEARGNGNFNLVLATTYISGGNNHFRLAMENPSGAWHHFTISREGAVQRLYLNGRLLSANPNEGGTPKSDPFAWDVPWRIGSRSNTPGSVHRTFPGSLDDMGVWERALSPDEIAALYNSGRGSDVPTAFASSLTAFYPFTLSLTADQLDDVSGNGFHGAIQNGATITQERAGSLYFKDGFGNVTALAGGGDSYRTGGSGNQVPVGTIMAWHKSFTNTPAIPDGWAECNGQTLDDPASPYHGQVIPDLNNPKSAWNTKGSFLRGDSQSGEFEDDAFQGHWHDLGSPDGNKAEFSWSAQFQNGGAVAVLPWPSDQLKAVDPIPSLSGDTPRVEPETRPANMSVVWIMKIRETDRDRGLWRENGEDIYFDDGNVGIGAKTANAKLHISAEDSTEAPLRIDAQTTIQGVQGRLYRAPITLENTDTNDLVDHQVVLTLDTQTLITGGKLRFDGGDMLFVDEDGKTILPHFIESGINTATTRAWVRVPEILAGESRVVFMQYGKPDANASASAASTFLEEIKDLALAWNFEEGSGTVVGDDSGNGISGNFSGTWTAGYRGNALSFDGTQGGGTSTPSTWGFDTRATISAWVKATSASPSGFGTIASLATSAVNNELLLSLNSDGTVTVYNIDSGGVSVSQSSTSSAITSDWVHVVGVIDGGTSSSTIRVYINGVRETGITSGTIAGALSDATGRRFSVGTRPGTSENFLGEIDQVRLYGRALSDSEIAAMHANESLVLAAHPGREFIYRASTLTPTITAAAEEPNPVSGSPILFAQNLTGNIGVGTDDPLARLHIAGTAGIDGIMFPDGSVQTTAGGGGDSTPLGTIIAWHKNLSGTPAIPEGWIECNGQTLNDGESPYDNQIIPDLNNDARFLRGGDTSGTLQDDAFQGHWHNTIRHNESGSSDTPYNVHQQGPHPYIQIPGARDAISDGTNGSPRVADETRPINMSVVWIMKIKQTGNNAWLSVSGGIAYTGGDVGIGTTTPSFELDVNGTVQCVNLIQTSDARRKKKVNTVDGALDMVDKLRGVRFEWDGSGAGGFSPPQGPQVGLIAQEVEDVLPEVVTTDRNGYKAVEYGKLVAVLIEAIKELKRDS